MTAAEYRAAAAACRALARIATDRPYEVDGALRRFTEQHRISLDGLLPPVHLTEIAEALRALAEAQANSERAMDARMRLSAGTTRARSTTANARWARAAEHRDRMLERCERLGVRFAEEGHA